MSFLPDVYVRCEVCHGARYNRETLGAAVMPAPVLAVGSVLPFQHTVEALRHRLAGEPYWAALGAELLVAAGWLALAALVYAWLDRRSRRTGGGLLRT